jgi:predicted nucleic acid-binding protein
LPKPRRGTAGERLGRKRVLVDSGGWIALLRSRDQHHAEADRAFRRAVAQRSELVTTDLIVAEVHRFLLFHVGIRAAAAFLDRLDASPSLTVKFADAALHAAARGWLRKLADQNVTYTDAVSFAVMEVLPCHAVLGFDRDFLVAGFALFRAQ